METFKKLCSSILILTLIVTMSSGCNVSDIGNSDILTTVWNHLKISEEPQQSYEKAPSNEFFEMKDKASIYQEEYGGDVLYITVGDGIGKNDENETWDNLNLHDLEWYEKNDQKQIECDALIQFGDEDGPTEDSFGYSDLAANASIKLTGQRASERQQKNYRIKIKSGSGNVAGSKSFVLSKGFADPYRFTNKLCFDLMQESDDLMSVRTRFVHVYVKDKNDGDNALFVDYGLYTMMETINKKYLSSRNLDDSGELYKVENFDFKRHEDAIVLQTDSKYDKEKFEKYLEAKGSEDYTCLINLLDALNDESADIDDIVDEYFDKDNIYSWMAFNILMDNCDTDTENFYLYSPTGSEKFYILPWDYDGALREDYNILKDNDYSVGWEKGIYLYTDSELFGRMIKDEKCLSNLCEHVDMLHESILSGDNVYKKALGYAEEVEPYLYSLPDKTFARVTKENYKKLIDVLPERMDENYYSFYDSIDKPSPFHINEPQKSDTGVLFSWDKSFNIHSDITYSFELSNSWDFKTYIANEKGLTDTQFRLDNLPAGEYFIRVTAYTADGISQEAYENYKTELKTTIHGVLCVYVLEDGTIICDK